MSIDLNAYDRLPALIRAALRQCRANISAKAILNLIQEGASIEETVALIFEVDRRMVNDADWDRFFWGVSP